MYDYLMHELPKLIEETFPVSGQRSIIFGVPCLAWGSGLGAARPQALQFFPGL